MKKEELIRSIADKTELAKKDVEVMLNSFIDVVKEQLGQGEEVMLAGFGKFFVRERAGRMGRNPQTGEEIEIPACKVPAFKISNALVKELKVVQ